MPSAQGYFTLSAAHISAIRQILKKQTSGSEHVYPCGPRFTSKRNTASRVRCEGAQRLTGFVGFIFSTVLNCYNFASTVEASVRGIEQ
jgi:hypothetical protein